MSSYLTSGLSKYITNYILTYFSKYFKNFNPNDSEVSLWSGMALFNNLNLNTEELDKEFNYPFSFVSGHIHEMKIIVPWTQINSQSIVVKINTIEITLKLKNGEQKTSKARSRDKKFERKLEAEKLDTGLLGKAISNLRFEFENVILKYVEEDIVLSLNVKKAIWSAVDADWNDVFIELSSELMRNKFTFFDMTICLDKTNSAGKIETYQEPLLYKCPFEVRILKMFEKPPSKIHHFIRIDAKFSNMQFSITDEQIPMLMRLFTLLLSLTKRDLRDFESKIPNEMEKDESKDDENNDSILSQAWGLISWVVTESIYDEEEIEDLESSTEEQTSLFDKVAHYGLYIENATFNFKGIERYRDKSYGSLRVKFIPFLKCQMKGFSSDIIYRDSDMNLHTGISQISIEGIGYCPCGMKDCTNDDAEKREENIYLAIGKECDNYLKNCLFNTEASSRPDFDYDFAFEKHVEQYTEELMLERHPAISYEALEVTTSPDIDDEDFIYKDKNMISTRGLTRVTVAPSNVKINSGSIHRIKMLIYSSELYNYEPYGDLNRFQIRKGEIESIDLINYENLDSAFDVFHFTIINPNIQIQAGDHPDYDKGSHKLSQVRRIKATTNSPLSSVFPNWPTLTFTCQCLDGKSQEPNFKFKKLILKSSEETEDSNLINNLYSYSLNAKIYNCKSFLTFGPIKFSLLDSFNVELNVRTLLLPPKNEITQIHSRQLRSDHLTLKLGKLHLMLSHLIIASCFDEKMSNYLTKSSILADFALSKTDLTIHFGNWSLLKKQTQHFISYHTKVENMYLNIEDEKGRTISVFKGFPSEDEEFLNAITQWPFHLYNESSQNQETRENSTVHLFLLKIGKYLIEYSAEFVDWISYHPISIDSLIPLEARSSGEMLYPMAPTLGRSLPSNYSRHSISSRSSFDELSRASQSEKILVFETPPQSSKKAISESHGSSKDLQGKLARRVGFSSMQDKFISPEEELEEPQTIESHKSWEDWIFEHMAIIKNLLISVSIQPGEIYFLIANTNGPNVTEEEKTLDKFIILTPQILFQPDQCKHNFKNDKIPVFLPPEILKCDFFPMTIRLDQFSYETHLSSLGKQQILKPISVNITLTLLEKKFQTNDHDLQVYVHCSLPTVKLFLDYYQVHLMIRILDQLLCSHAILMQRPTTLMLPPLEMESELFAKIDNAKEESEGSTGFDSATSHSRNAKNSLFTGKSIENSSLLGSSEVPLNSEETPIGEKRKEKTANIWIQLTLSHLSLVISGLDATPKGEMDSSKVIAFEIEEIMTTLDFQTVYTKWLLKASSISARIHDRNLTDRWSLGRRREVIFSSNEEISRNIRMVRSEIIELHSHDSHSSGSSSPDLIEAKSQNVNTLANIPKMRNFLTFTFIKVQCNNYHRKSEIVSPMKRWNHILEKSVNKDSNLFTSSDSETLERKKFIGELDLKLKAIDIVFNPSALLPFARIFKDFNSMEYSKKFPQVSTRTQIVPTFNNNTAPLVYLETESIRFFIRSSTSKLHFPDTLLLQLSKINIKQQMENLIHRTIVESELFRMAEKSRIILVHGSPIEDRQYQIDVNGILIATCFWSEIKTRNKNLFFNRRYNSMLKTMGENPAWEWNTIRSDSKCNEIVALPILSRQDIEISYAPPIVYERSIKDPTKSIVVAGAAFELYATTDTVFYLNLNQLTSILNFCIELDSFTALISPNIPNNIEKSSLATIPIIVNCPESSTLNSPLDVTITGKVIRFSTYDLSFESISDSEEFKGIVTLASFHITQPHLFLSLALKGQKCEVSFYDADFCFSKSNKISTYLPEPDEYPEKVFYLLPKDPDQKTGMTPQFFTLTLTDFMTETGSLRMELSHSLKFDWDTSFILNIHRIQKLILNCYPPQAKMLIKKPEITKEKSDLFRSIVGRILNANIVICQVLFCVNDCSSEQIQTASAAIEFGTTEITLKSHVKKGQKLATADRAIVNVNFSSITLSTGIGTKLDLILYPSNLRIFADKKWRTWGDPFLILKLYADPIRLNLSAQAIITFLQLESNFREILQSFEQSNQKESVKVEKEESNEMEQSKLIFNDDLKSGTFKYIMRDESGEFPSDYQVVFCSNDRTMTWRYPQQRFITKIESNPVPFPSNESSLLECKVEYYDETREKFFHYGNLILSETQSCTLMNYETSKPCSTMWRISIISPIEDSVVDKLIRPEIFAGCLQVDTYVDRNLLQNLKLYIIMPQLHVTLTNSRLYANKNAGQFFNQRIQGGLNFSDEEFGVLEATNVEFMAAFGKKTLYLDFNSFFKFDVVDYSHLTYINVLDPFSFKFCWTYRKQEIEDLISDFEVTLNPVAIKLGVSSAHILSHSLALFHQVLASFDGSRIWPPNSKSISSTSSKLYLTKIKLCNNTNQMIFLSQCDDDCKHSIRPKEVYSFVWNRQSVAEECKVTFNLEDPKWSLPITFNEIGTISRIIKKTPIFFSIKKATGYKKTVEIFGSIIIANATSEDLHVSIKQKGSEEEIVEHIAPYMYESNFLSFDEIEEMKLGFDPTTKITVDLKKLRKEKPKSSIIALPHDGKVLNFWITLIEENVNSGNRFLIAVSGCYYVRSLIPHRTEARLSDSKQENKYSICLRGCGAQEPLKFYGDFKATQHLTFRTDDQVQFSSPSIPLIPGGPTIEESNEKEASIENILDHIKVFLTANSTSADPKYPYIGENKEDLKFSFKISPNSPLNVEFKQWIVGLPTQLVLVKPKSLFVNNCGTTIYYSESNIQDIYVPSSCVFLRNLVPFKIGLGLNNEIMWSQFIEISFEKSRADIHHININSQLPIGCFSRLDIPFGQEIFHLTFEAQEENGIICISISPTYSLLNRTDLNLEIKGLSLSKRNKMDENVWNALNFHQISKQKEDTIKENAAMPLLNFYQDDETYDFNSTGMKYLAFNGSKTWWFVKLMQFEIIFNNMAASREFSGKRLAFAIPISDQRDDKEGLKENTFPLILSWTCNNGQVWFDISKNEIPDITIFNHTDFIFNYGIASFNQGTPIEDADHFNQFHISPSKSISHLSLPIKHHLGQEIGSSNESCSLLLAKKPNSDLTNFSYLAVPDEIKWLRDIRLEGDSISSQFLRVAQNEDIKITVEKLGSAYYIYIENITNIEVSAKDIRGRISQHCLNIDEPKSHHDIHFAQSSLEKNNSNKLKMNIPLEPIWTGKLFFRGVSIIFTDDLTHPNRKSEILSLNLNDIFIERSTQLGDKELRIINKKDVESNIKIYIGNFQVNCPQSISKRHDFQVIMRPEVPYCALRELESLSLNMTGVFRKLENYSDRFVIESRVTYGNVKPDLKEVRKVWVKFRPMIVNVEDYLFDSVVPSLQTIYTGMSEIEKIPSSFPFAWSNSDEEFEDSDSDDSSIDGSIQGEKEGTKMRFSPHWKNYSLEYNNVGVPSHVLALFKVFQNPLRIEKLNIEASEAILTFRMSRSLYLAVDNSRLKINAFDADLIVTSSVGLGQAISNHYLMSAVFNSLNPVSLIGSLELIGSPTTFARTLSVGFKDFVVNPYEGFFHGPVGFFMGFNRGCYSLMRHFSVGSLTSVTNWAWSVSRNIDNLTLSEDEQLIMAVEGRRAELEGFLDGLKQGISGFGLRLLGAIAAMANEPIQMAIRGGPTPTNIITGLGKGILGLVTRPISGTVELVAMAGQGLLDGAGWLGRVEMKHEAFVEEIVLASPSALLATWRLAVEGYLDGMDQILMAVEASQQTSEGTLIPVILVLTTQWLHVFDVGTESICESHSISVISSEWLLDETLLGIRLRPPMPTESASFAKQRLIEYLREVSPQKHSDEMVLRNLRSEELDEAQKDPGNRIIGDYFVSPHAKKSFIGTLEWLIHQNEERCFKILKY